MKCVELEELWVAHEDGNLPAAAEGHLRAHLDACPRCAKQFGRLAALEQQLEGLGDEPAEPPPFFKARVLAGLGEVRTGRSWSLRGIFSSRRLLAVSMACLAFFAGLLVREVRQLNQWAHESGLQSVVLEFQAPNARQVQVVGDFNDWGRYALPVKAEQRDGRWVFRMDLAPGSYQYSYLIDGKRWLPDPGATGIIPDGFGGQNSLLYVSSSSVAKSL